MKLIERIGRYRHLLPALLCLGMVAQASAGEASAPPPSAAAEQVFAMVNGKPIYTLEYNARYNALLRQRYYHGAPPEGQDEAVRKEVADLLIERMLLAEEAEKRGFKPDAAKIEEAVAAAEARYGAAPEWQKQREVLLPKLKEQIARQSLHEQMEKVIRDVPPPASAEVRAYYGQKPELFTEPEKLSLSLILLKVDPGAPRADLEKAQEEAKEIYLRLKKGADFAELARQHSGDSSAASGGKLGYVHGGMLPEKLQEKISTFQVGEVTAPIRTLEGVALYRVDDRVAPVLREFAEVESRAQDLLRREKQDQAWKDAISRLRGDARIEILLPIANGGAKQNDSPAETQSVVTKPGNLLSSKPDAELTPPASSVEQSDAGKQGGVKKKSSKKKSSNKMP